MTYKTTTLVENTVYGRGLQGEHGFCLLIEAGDKKILLDTGASDLFVRNARILDIDLKEVDYVILSHGHRDHTGGLKYFLALNAKAKIICKQEVFQRKFKDNRENGIYTDLNIDKGRLWLVDTTTEIVPGVYVLPQIKLVEKEDTHFEHFFTECDGELIPDTFEDELAVVLSHKKTFSVLSSCSHRGITNIIRTAQAEFPSLGINLVLGGFHIYNDGPDKFRTIYSFLGVNLPKRLGVCHCTGVDKFALFRQQFNDRAFYNYTGWVEDIK